MKIGAVGRVIKERRLLFVFVLVLLVIGTAVGVYAVSDTDQFDGQLRAGDHNWWEDVGDASFCARCHQAVAADILAGPHGYGLGTATSDCTFCHTPDAGGHAAGQAYCTDCHGAGTQLTQDAHAGILTDLGESPDMAARTCQTCHTHMSINITTEPQPPIELIMGN